MCIAPVSAQTPLSLDQAIAEALQNHPQLAIADARIQEANGQRVQAGVRPNPRITLQTEDIRPSYPNAPFSFANATEDYFLIGQVIETAGKRERRLDYANSTVSVTDLQRDQVRRQVISRVAAAYWTAVSAQRVKDLNLQNLRTYDEDVTYSSNRVKEGVAAEADLIRIQIERDRVRAALLTATRDADQAQVELYRAMNRTSFKQSEPLSGQLETIPAVQLPDISQILALRPDVKVAERGVQQAEADLGLQKANGKPDPEVFLGYKRNAGFDTAYAAVQVDVPIRNRNQGNISSAAARLHAAEANLRQVQLTVRSDFEAAQRYYLDGRALLSSLPETVARAQQSEQLARAAYREGALDLLKLLDAERSRIQVQIDYFRALSDIQQSIVNLKLVSGESISGEKP